MNFESVNSDTLTIEDGEWQQLVEMLGDDGLRARCIIVETDEAQIELAADYASPHGLDIVVQKTPMD